MTEWAELNRAALFAEIAAVERLILGQPGDSGELEAAQAALPSPSALEMLVSSLQLSPFERGVVVACAGLELRPELAQACLTASGAPYPSFGLLLATLPDAHFSATTLQAPLRHFGILDARGDDLMHARLRLDERVLHHLLGVASLDARLAAMVEPLHSDGELLPSQKLIADRLVAHWQRPRATRAPVVQLCGTDGAGQLAIAVDACSQLGLSLWRLRAADLPTGPLDRDLLVRMWEREAALTGSALVLEADDETPEALRNAVSFVERLGSLVLVSARTALPLKRAGLRLDVERLTVDDQLHFWQNTMGPEAAGSIEPAMAQFRLGLTGLRAAAAEILEGDGDLAARAWSAFRVQARPRLDDLAQRIETRASWDELVLPPPKLRLLHDVAAHVKNARTVYEHWGFAGRGTRGLGITALFAGASGTGKTMAAEVLAGELGIDLYKIDLSQVVSKYIGETEKNLRRIFDAAEECGALLLFDEADALFGKRSEVKDSHDRYANLEVSYLLQRMEQYRGLAVLTTNMRHALDHAFLRRLRFVIEFPFPDAGQRAEIWKRVFPAPTPLGNLDHARLAKLAISGGVIRSIALNAAFLAADAGQPIDMQHLRHAARDEFLKLEKPFDGEL
jgi:hypothetical protein